MNNKVKTLSHYLDFQSFDFEHTWCGILSIPDVGFWSYLMWDFEYTWCGILNIPDVGFWAYLMWDFEHIWCGILSIPHVGFRAYLMWDFKHTWCGLNVISTVVSISGVFGGNDYDLHITSSNLSVDWFLVFKSLSTIFQLYRGSQFYWRRKLKKTISVGL